MAGVILSATDRQQNMTGAHVETVSFAADLCAIIVVSRIAWFAHRTAHLISIVASGTLLAARAACAVAKEA